MKQATRLTILIALVSILAVPSAGAAGPDKTQTLRFFAKEVSMTVTHADGSVDRKPPFGEPQAGDILDVNSLDYLGDHRHHAKRYGASHHLQCVFAEAEGAPDCVSHVAIGGSLLIFRGYPGTLINGTGRYQGATGRVLKNKEVKGGSDVVARIHTR